MRKVEGRERRGEEERDGREFVSIHCAGWAGQEGATPSGSSSILSLRPFQRVSRPWGGLAQLGSHRERGRSSRRPFTQPLLHDTFTFVCLSYEFHHSVTFITQLNLAL